MSLAAWARAADTGVSRALVKVDLLPQSETGHGLAVPFPFLDRSAIKGRHSNREINAAITAAPKVSVPLDGLHAIQHSVKRAKLVDHLSRPSEPGTLNPETRTPVDLPIVIQQDGVRYIWDGHHRATVAKLRGLQSVRARLVDFDAPNETRGSSPQDAPALRVTG